MISAALDNEMQPFLELVMLTNAPSAVKVRDVQKYVLQLKLTEKRGITQVDVVSGLELHLFSCPLCSFGQEPKSIAEMIMIISHPALLTHCVEKLLNVSLQERKTSFSSQFPS